MVPPTDSYKFFPYTTLFRSEAARAIHRERGGQGLPRIEQRTPQPLAVAGRDQQAVGIVHFGPEVRAMRLVLAEEEHAGERRDPERCVSRTQEDAPAHVHHGLGPGMDVDVV